MSRYLMWSAGGALLWAGGDFLAQFYAAHREAAARRARGEKRSGSRPSGSQMLGMLDQGRLLQSAGFGAVSGPLVYQYKRLLPRVFGPLMSAATPTLCALAVQQLFATPLLLCAYFNAMTALRGGLSDPSFLVAHSTGATKRQDVWSVEQFMMEEVMPQPLLASWAVMVPLYAFAYTGPFRGAAALSGAITLPWCASVAYVQSELLL